MKRERPSVVKTENEIDDAPFVQIDVHCGQNDSVEKEDVTQAQIISLKKDKAELIDNLLKEKQENQKLFFEVKSKEEKNTAQEVDIVKLKKMIDEQKIVIADLTRAKIKQLMAQTSANAIEDEFDVEAILNHRGRKGHRQFLIRWKNYSSDDDSWQPESNLNCSDILQEYKKAKGI